MNNLTNIPTRILQQELNRRSRYRFSYNGPDDYDPNYDTSECYDSGLSYTQQVWADRADYAREMYEAGHIDETQRMEIEMGA